jgi:hypothetical protein
VYRCWKLHSKNYSCVSRGPPSKNYSCDIAVLHKCHNCVTVLSLLFRD